MLLDWMKTAPTLADDPVSGFDPDAVTVSETVEIAAPARGWSMRERSAALPARVPSRRISLLQGGRGATSLNGGFE